MVRFEFDDGGRQAAGFKGSAGDCVTRAVAIASGKPYREVYSELAAVNQTQRKGRKMAGAHVGKKTARHGIFTNRVPFKRYMQSLGFEWVPLMGIGTGCKVHLRADELPKEGRYVLSLSKHFAAYVDGVLRDTYDCSRDGDRCVYGYWRLSP